MKIPDIFFVVFFTETKSPREVLNVIVLANGLGLEQKKEKKNPQKRDFFT